MLDENNKINKKIPKPDAELVELQRTIEELKTENTKLKKQISDYINAITFFNNLIISFNNKSWFGKMIYYFDTTFDFATGQFIFRK